MSVAAYTFSSACRRADSSSKPVKLYRNLDREFRNFSHLGRRYRLLLMNDQDRPLKLAGGRFRLQRTEAPNGREHFIRKYTEHAQRWLEQRVQPWATRMGVQWSGLEARDLGCRWGSCGNGGETLLPLGCHTGPAQPG